MDIFIRIFLLYFNSFSYGHYTHMGKYSDNTRWQTVPCGLPPIPTCIFPSYFPAEPTITNSQVSLQSIIYRNITPWPEFPSIHPCHTTHGASIDVEEADLEMSKETTQICHFHMVVLLAPLPERTLSQTHHNEHREIAPPGKKGSFSNYRTLTICQVLGQALVSTSGDKKGSLRASLWTRRQRGVG